MAARGARLAGELMPPAAGAAVAGFLGIKSTIGVFLVQAALGVGASLVLGGLSAVLAKRPRGRGAEARDRSVSVRQAAMPHQIIVGQQRIGGTITFLHTSGAQKQFIHIVSTWAGHEVQGIGTPFLDDQAVVIDQDGWCRTGRFDQHVFMESRLGTDGQTAITQLQSQAPDKWTAEHRQAGCAHSYLRLEWDPDVFPNGLPSIAVDIAGANDIYDPRSQTTVYSTNPALVVAWYLTNPRFEVRAPWAAIDEDKLIEAANICDEQVPLAAGGTEPRYRCDGAWDIDSQPIDILPQLLSSMAGTLVNVGGKWQIYAGAYRAPTRTLTLSDVRGGIETSSQISGRESFNAVQGTYRGPTTDWQESDFPGVKGSMANENGERHWKDISLPFTRTPSMCQRLAKIELLRAQQPLSTRWPVKFSKGYPLFAPDVVSLTAPRYVWDNKPFEIVNSSIVLDNADGSPRLGVDLSMRETTAAIYDWTTDEESAVDEAPNTDLPSPWIVAAPGQPIIDESLYQTRGSAGVKARADVHWEPSSDAFVGSYVLEYRLATASDWTALAPVTTPETAVFDVAPGLYQFRVRAINGLGASSPYGPVLEQQIFGLLAPPAGLTGLRLEKTSNLALLYWNRHPDLDTRIGGQIRWRHSPKLTGATWVGATAIGAPSQGGQTQAVLPLKRGTYLARPFDSSHIRSDVVASVTTDGATTLPYSPVLSVVEHPTFPGTKTNVAVLESRLRLIGQGLISTIPLISAVSSIASYGGVVPAGTYRFSAGIDLDAIKSVRLVTDLDAITINPLDRIGDRALPISQWPSITGAEPGDADAQIYVRQTDDDPTGSPTWSDWSLITAGEYLARAFEFELRLSTSDPTSNILVSILGVTAFEVA